MERGLDPHYLRLLIYGFTSWVCLPSSTLGREEIIRIIRIENVVCGGGMEGLALAQEGQGAREPATGLTALGRDIEHGKRASRGPFGVTEAAERNKQFGLFV